MKTQYEVFSATMDNFSKAVEANEVALSSSGSAMQENEKYMKGLDAQTNVLKATWNDLINEALNSETVGSILSIATGFLEWTDNMGGLIPVLGLLAGAITTVSLTMLALRSSMGIGDVVTALKTKLTGMLDTIKLLAMGAGNLGQYLGVAGIAITAVTGLVRAYNAEQKRLREEAVDTSKEIKEQSASYDGLIQQYKNIIDSTEDEGVKTEKLTELKSQLSEQYGIEDNALKALNSTRQEGIDLLEKEKLKTLDLGIAEIADEYDKAYNKIYKDQYNYLGQVGSGAIENSGVKDLFTDFGFSFEETADGFTNVSLATENLYQQYDKLTSAYAELSRKKNIGNGLSYEEDIVYGYLADAVGIMSQEYDDLITIVENYNGLTAEQILLEEDVSSKTFSKKDSFDAWKASVLQANSGTEQFNQILSEAIDGTFPEWSGAISSANTGLENLGEIEEDIDDNTKDLTNQFDNLKKKLEVSSDALDDYNDYGGMTSETLSDLQGQFPDLYSAFFNLDGSLNSAGQSAFDTAGDVYGLITAYKQLKSELALGNLKEASAGQDRIVYDKAYKEYWQAVQELEGWEKQAVELRKRAATSTGGGGGGGGGGSAKDPLEEQSDIFKEQIEILEHELFLQEQIEGTEQEQIELNKKLQELVAQQADWYRSKGLDNTSEYIRDLQKQWWGYYDDIKSLEESITEIKEEEAKKQLEIAQEEAREQLEIAQDLIDKQTSALEKEKSDMETAFSYLSQIINEQIQLAQDEMDAIDEALQKEVDALKEENDVLNEQIALEEKLEALAKAKAQRKLVYQNGQFVYSQDYDAISSAQDELDTYNREQALEEEIAELKANAEIEKGLLKKKIARWQEYLDSYSGIVDDYELEQDRLIAEHILETQLEQDNWDIRLSQAQEFADRYNSIMSTLSAVATASEDISSGGTSSRDDIIAQMKANSQAWFDADDETKEALHQANDELNALLGGTSSDYNGSTGEWSTLASGSDVSSTIGSSVSSNDLLYPGTSTPNVSSYTNTSSSSSVSTTFNNAVFNVPNEATMDSLLSTLPEASRATSYSR